MIWKHRARSHPVRPPQSESVELTDDDLEFVVGGLQRTWEHGWPTDPVMTQPVQGEEPPAPQPLP